MLKGYKGAKALHGSPFSPKLQVTGHRPPWAEKDVQSDFDMLQLSGPDLYRSAPMGVSPVVRHIHVTRGCLSLQFLRTCQAALQSTLPAVGCVV